MIYLLKKIRYFMGDDMATRKKTSKSKKPAAKSEPSFRKTHPHLIFEIVVLLFVAISLLLMISIYLNIGGVLGEGIRRYFFGIFGWAAYLLPVFLFVASFLKIFNKGNQRLNNKLMFAFVFIVVISILSHLTHSKGAQIFQRFDNRNAFFAATTTYFLVSAESKIGGGIVGGFFSDLFEVLLGKTGSFIVLISIAVVLLIVITEKSGWKLVMILYNWLKILGQKLKVLFVRWLEASKEKQKLKASIKESRLEPTTPQNQVPDDDDDMLNDEIEIAVPGFLKRWKRNFLNQSLLDETEGKAEPELNQSELLTEENFETNKKNMIKLQNDEKDSEVKEWAEPTAFIPNIKTEKKMDPFTQIQKQEEKERINEVRKVLAKPEIYQFPPLEFLLENKSHGHQQSKSQLDSQARKLETTLESFGVKATVVDISVGPAVTRYELQPEIGVKVSKIVNLADDIALNLSASGIRIEAPIPGKPAVGIEVPNLETSPVFLREVIETKEFSKHPSKVAFALGKDIGGKIMIADIGKMPHLLVAGATGSGKSVCINTLIVSILYRSTPEEVRLLMIDPKVVELSVYNGIPHLLIPVVTEPKKAAGALNWAVQEMSDRYKLFAAANVRDISGFNKLVEERQEGKKMPQIIIIVDELADLMMVAQNDVEDAICRLAQMARAAGIHLIIATQRPSVDVITGLIKANIPSRIAFSVSSGIDSRTIIDSVGAEKLLGKGDMLFYPVGLQKPVRVQGAFVSDKEVERIVTFLKTNAEVDYNEKIMQQLAQSGESESGEPDKSDFDSLFNEALDLVVDKQKASASMIQRRFRVGYNRAARIVDQLHEAGFVGEEEGSKPRTVLLDREAYTRMKEDAAKRDATPSDIEN